MVYIRAESIKDINDIHSINERAFGRKNEAELVDNLRKKKATTLSLVAEVEGQIVGHILFSPIKVKPDNSHFNSVTLAPLAVLPEYQRNGIGSQLVKAGFEECSILGNDFVFVVGHPKYYPRFGFIQARVKGFICEFKVPDEAWMVFELGNQVSMEKGGTVYFHPEFKNAID
ncbi:MAG: N-acetyltransferase [Dehalococcoidia bacterium]|nr:MAG: N-acetyltransferase [Dehalococcoidia bacterium]